jgi:hypothetical protein
MLNRLIDSMISSTTAWSIMTGLVVIILIFDGIMTNLPFYDLQSRNALTFQLFFATEVLICALCQIIYLKIIKEIYEVNPIIGPFRKYANITNYIVSVTQYLIIVLLLATLLEIGILNQYHTIVLLIQLLMSILLSAGISALLAYRLLLWIKHKGDYLIIAYTATAVLISINSIFIALFMSLEIQGKPWVIDPSMFYSNYQITNYDFHQIQSNISFASFIALWFASTLLLRRQRRKWGAVKFYIVISLPLVYYLGIIQLILSSVLVQHHILSSIESYTFNVINSILTRPVGGILFGVAFWMIGRSVGDNKISEYMKLSAIGIMLLSISNQDAGTYLLPYPPFGLPTITFLGISSYLLFVGIYYSSVSISVDTALRRTIESSVEEQFKFVSKIGRSQMEREIENRVKGVTKRSAKILEENSGIQTHFEDSEVEEYVKFVVKEREKM